MTYSGALSQLAHFPRYTSVPGVSGGHIEPESEPDPFSPNPPPVQPTTADVWQPEDVSQHTEMMVKPVSHWADLQRPVPSNVEGTDDDLATTARMLANHSVVEYRPLTYIPYKHATQGLTIEYVDGRRPVQPSTEAFLMGRNSYDATNQPSEVYGGDRYRVGTEIERFGRYEYWTKQGQDGWLRAYTGLNPAFPVDKPRIEDSAPYTPNSAGTTTWVQNQFQAPSTFALPSESAMSDFQLATGAPTPEGTFDDGSRM
ncbi:hypothetical protein ACWC9H_35380 [Streptomyces sp. NPDC001251]